MATYTGTTGNDIINWPYQSSLTYDGLAGLDTVNIQSDHGRFGTIAVETATGRIAIDTSVVSTVSAASIQLTNVEKVTFSDGWTVQVGSTAVDQLTGGSSVDQLHGMAGNDILNGGAGADALFGGAGNDTFFVDNIGDRVYESTTTSGTTDAGGVDTVKSSLSFTLGNFVEKLTLTGRSALNGTGNTLNNTLVGNTGANVLSGLGGNDILKGGGGNDTLIGGTGKDTLNGGTGRDAFRFDVVPTSPTKIQDFVAGTDRVELQNAAFTSLVTAGQLATGQLRAGAGVTQAADSNDFLLYNSTTGALYYDADGNGAGAATQIGTLSTGLGLTYRDFMVI